MRLSPHPLCLRPTVQQFPGIVKYSAAEFPFFRIKRSYVSSASWAEVARQMITRRVG